MRRKTFSIFVYFLVAAPIIVAVVALVSRERWFPAGDMAQAELHMRGFFRRPPLVGAAGRIVSDTGYQGSHPGPSLWIAMLPIYLLGGRTSDALMAAAASVHLVSIAGILHLAHRRYGRVFMMMMALGILFVLRSSGTDFMIEPWNPWLALLPFVVFVLLILELLAPVHVSKSLQRTSADVGSVKAERIQLVLAVIVGSHCVQSHAGYALLIVPPLVVTVLTVGFRHLRMSRHTSHFSSLRMMTRTFVWAVGSATLMWMPALIDQFRRRPGNLTILFAHFGSPNEPTLGIAKTLDIVTSQLNVFGAWILGPGAPGNSILKWIGFSLFVALIASSYFAPKSAADRRIISLLVGFMFLGIVSIMRIFGPFYEYTVRWFWLLTTLSIAASSMVLLRWIKIRQRNFPALPSVGMSVLVIGLVGLSVISVWQAVDRAKLPGATDSRILSGLIDDTVANLDSGKTYQIRFYDPYTLNATGFGLLLELERRGFDVKVDPEFAAAALPHRTAPMGETDQVLWVVVGPAVERAARDPSLMLLATYNPRTSEQQKRSQQLLREVADGLRRAGREDLVASLESPGASILFTEPPLPEATAILVRELIRMGQPTSVFSMSVKDVAASLR